MDRTTDRPHELYVYVGLAQARPNKDGVKLIFKIVWVAMCSLVMSLSSCDFLIKYFTMAVKFTVVEHMQSLVFR